MMKKLLVPLSLVFSFVLHSQSDISANLENYNQKLKGIDKKSIKTKYLLNKGFLMTSILDDYFEYKEYDEDAFTIINRKGFRTIYKGLRKSDIKKTKRLAKFDFKSLRAKYKSRPNSVPLGVIQAKGEFLDSLQIENNIKKTANNIP